MDSTVHGILQARILEWVAFPFSRGSSQPGIKPRSPALQVDSLPSEPPGKPKLLIYATIEINLKIPLLNISQTTKEVYFWTLNGFFSVDLYVFLIVVPHCPKYGSSVRILNYGESFPSVSFPCGVARGWVIETEAHARARTRMHTHTHICMNLPLNSINKGPEECVGSLVVHTDFVALQHVDFSQTRDGTCVPGTGRGGFLTAGPPGKDSKIEHVDNVELDHCTLCASMSKNGLLFYNKPTPKSQWLYIIKYISHSCCLLNQGFQVEGWGGKQWSLGISLMEVLPCSRVAHIERKKKPYNSNIGFYTKRNALRVAEVWMDDYKSHVYIAWNLPLENPGIDIGDVSERRALRKSLKCKNFQWYLDHVYPEMRRYNNTVAYGELRNNKAKDVCLDQGPMENHTAILYPCHGWGPQLARYTKEGFLHLGALGTTTLLPDTRCLVDNAKSRLPQLLDCDKVKSSLYKRWNFIQNGAIMNRGTGRCLEVENRGLAGIDLTLRSCTGQRWTIKNSIK
ncbi:hypothetical protein FD754_015257 [Muntiacus muntjak]|uniref:polypeptide N-acetylgalactosaminyltransferase n=1 Tax=Muntiacus muntjak TaxID=9888 RepID=A0A5N3VM43_MUNMU|nr:hypothetical protein FD754_015257 [Muntiacus muntjak]